MGRSPSLAFADPAFGERPQAEALEADESRGVALVVDVVGIEGRRRLVKEIVTVGAPALHDRGNLLEVCAFARGDVDAALAHAAHVLSETFETQRIEHAFLVSPEDCARLDWGAVAFIVSAAGGASCRLDGQPLDIFDDFGLRSADLLVCASPAIRERILARLLAG